MDGLFSGQLAQVSMASLGVKALLSGLKFLFPSIGEPHPFTPIQVRVAAIIIGLFCGLALKIAPLTLPAGAHIVYAYGNHILGGLLIGLGALGAHEGVDMVKKPAA